MPGFILNWLSKVRIIDHFLNMIKVCFKVFEICLRSCVLCRMQRNNQGALWLPPATWVSVRFLLCRGTNNAFYTPPSFFCLIMRRCITRITISELHWKVLVVLNCFQSYDSLVEDVSKFLSTALLNSGKKKINSLSYKSLCVLQHYPPRRCCDFAQNVLHSIVLQIDIIAFSLFWRYFFIYSHENKFC